MVNGLSGERMLIGLAVGIAVLIFLVLKTKIQAFLALIISTVVVGVIGGMPLTNITIEVDGVWYCKFDHFRVWRNLRKYRNHYRIWCYDGPDL